MKLAIDCNALVALSRPDDALAAWRLAYLLESPDSVLVLSTPVIAEFLVRADAADLACLDKMERSRRLVVAPFCRRAASSCAALERAAHAAGSKRGGSAKSWQAVKIDRQVLAIAMLHDCERLITDDPQIHAMGRKLEFECWHVGDLPTPQPEPQLALDLDTAAAAAAATASPPSTPPGQSARPDR